MKAWPRVDPVLLVLALVAGAALRADRLGLAEMTTDEAFSWRMSTHPAADIVARTATDVHPPLYYVALKAWRAVAGDSPAALRGFSMVLGLAAVLLASLLCLEADRYAGAASDEARAATGGAAAAAVLVAVHADQVSHSRHLRMYAMGAVLAGLSAWLLLRALRSERRAYAWWGAYAVAAAALCYTHYYGAFSVAAQLLFVSVALARRWRTAGIGRREALGLGAAALVLAVLYAPWLAVLRRQTARVSEDYWIHDVGPVDVAAALMRWGTGLEWASPWPLLVIASFAAAGTWAMLRGDRGQRFLAVQAVLPWLGALGLSLLAGRTLFLERYLFFSQFALLVYLGRLWGSLAAPWGRRALALALGSLLGLGLAEEVGARPSAPPSAPEGARLLARGVGPHDLVCASSPRDLNVMRYYLDREGARRVQVTCPASRAIGHLSQVSSILREEIVEDERVWSGEWAKVWRVRLHPPRKWRPEPPPSDWTLVFTRVFEGPASTRLLVTAYERQHP